MGQLVPLRYGGVCRGAMEDEPVSTFFGVINGGGLSLGYNRPRVYASYQLL